MSPVQNVGAYTEVPTLFEKTMPAIGALGTYLGTAPHHSMERFGRCIMSVDLVRGLGELNSQIRAWEQYKDGLWWPGKDAQDRDGGVLTCLWLGEPGGKSKKITAFRVGPIPEYTQLWDDGRIKMKGWRAIFEKVLTSHCGVTKAQIEAKFNISLDTDSPDKVVYCIACRRYNKWVKSNGGRARLCSMHDKMRELALQAKSARRELRG